MSLISWNGNNTISVTATDAAGNISGASTFKSQYPAGVAGEPINLGLSPEGIGAQLVTVTIWHIPQGWTLNGGIHNADGSWTIQTSDPSALTVTTPINFSGAMLLDVVLSWTNADGTMSTMQVANNVEAYAPGTPIFAWSGKDTLTGSAAADTFIFSQPIGDDTVFNFAAAADKIDLIGYAGFANFADVMAHTADDSAGNAHLQLADGQSITLIGVQSTGLTAANFVFDQTPQVANAGDMVIGNGAMLPLSGIVTNTGTISLQSSGSDTLLQLIQYGMTLQGGGHLLLSDSPGNIISGTLGSVTFTNVDNVIEGAGRIGNGTLTLTNAGTITATGSHSLIIDTGANIVANSGTLGATGAGGLYIASALANSGTLLASGGYIGVAGAITGGGTASISGGGALFLHSAADLSVTIGTDQSGTIVLFDSVHFTGNLSGFDGNDSLVLEDVHFSTTTTLLFQADADGHGGTLTASDGADTATIHLNGIFDPAQFHMAGDAAGGTVLTYGSGLEPVLPVEPHWG